MKVKRMAQFPRILHDRFPIITLDHDGQKTAKIKTAIKELGLEANVSVSDKVPANEIWFVWKGPGKDKGKVVGKLVNLGVEK